MCKIFSLVPSKKLVNSEEERAMVPEQSEGKQMILHNSSKARIAKKRYLKVPNLQIEQSEIDANIL